MPHKALTLSAAPESTQTTLDNDLLSVGLREPAHQLRQETAELLGLGDANRP